MSIVYDFLRDAERLALIDIEDAKQHVARMELRLSEAKRVLFERQQNLEEITGELKAYGAE